MKHSDSRFRQLLRKRRAANAKLGWARVRDFAHGKRVLMEQTLLV